MLATFEKAYNAFVPQDDDPKDNIPFYRTAAGLQAAWGKDFCDKHNSAFHQAACESGYGNPQTLEERYRAAVVTLRHFADTMTLPQEPLRTYGSSCYSCPQEPTEADAYNLFKAEFKTAFPEHRVNSKFANEKWAEKKEQALQIVRVRYQASLSRWEQEQERLANENEQRRSEWQAKCDKVNQFKAAVAQIVGA